jgi:dolichol-phosphate mannosyltransferase
MATDRPLITIVSPVFQAEEFLDELVERIENTVRSITDNFEIILVDDGSRDKSWVTVERLAKARTHINGIKLSRNFGQHYAITAGLDQARGEWIVVMDCDLQDQPEEIKKLWEKCQEGYEVVLARRGSRKDGFLKIISSKIFYRTLVYLTGSNQDETIANFGIYHEKVISEIVGMRESIRYFPSMVQWVGFRQSSIGVEHGARKVGLSNYTFKRLFDLGLDIMLAFSDKPLRLTVKLGLAVALTGFLFALYTFIQYVRNEIVVLGYASLIISIWVLSGLILATLGMVGLYVGKIFEGVKNRPIYIIDKKI